MRFLFLSSFKKCDFLAHAQYICYRDGDVLNLCEEMELSGGLRLDCSTPELIRDWELCAQGISEVKP